VFTIIKFLQGASGKRFLDVLGSRSFIQFLALNIMLFNLWLFIGFT
jgi:hypothetical protein